MTSSSTFSSCWTSLRARSSAMLDRSRSSSIAPLAPGEGGMQTASYYAHFPSLWQPARAWTSSLEFLRGYPDAPALRLTTDMTLAAWVKPSTVSSAWLDVIYKGDDNYYLEATSTTNSLPAGG